MAILTIRPSSHENIGSILWQNPLNSYNGDLNTWATIASSKSNCGNTRIKYNFSFSSVPSNAIISKVELAVYGRASSNPTLGSNKIKVSDKNNVAIISDGSTSNKWYTFDATNAYSTSRLDFIFIEQVVTQTIGTTTVNFFINDIKIDITYELPRVSSVNLDKTNVKVSKKDKALINATINTIGQILNLNIDWSIDDTNIATIESSTQNQATIKPLSAGTTTLRASSNHDNTKYAVSTITVEDAVSNIYISTNKVQSIYIGSQKVSQVYYGNNLIYKI